MTPSARVSLISATESIVTLIAGVVTLVMGKEFGWLLILLSLIGGTIGAGFIFLGRQSMAHVTALSLRRTKGRTDTPTAGEILSKRDTVDVMPMRWVGSARVPSTLGYVIVGPPLAVVEVRQGGLLFRVRPRIAGILFGIENLMVTPDDNVVILPAQRRGSTGIELRMSQRPSYYFWTKRRDEVMVAAAAVGLEVSGAETA